MLGDPDTTPMKINSILFSLLTAVLLSSCQNEEKKHVCFIEEYSTQLQRWVRVMCVYGYGDNQVVADAFVAAYQPRTEIQYRVVGEYIPKDKLKSLDDSYPK